MFGLRESTPLEMLRQFANYFNASLVDSPGSALLDLSNEQGRGTIKLFELYPGLTAWIYDIEFAEDFEFEFEFSGEKPYYLAYHLKGRQFHKYESEDTYMEIRQWQNFFLMGCESQKADFKIPGGELLQSCYLILHPDIIGDTNFKAQSHLDEYLDAIFQKSSANGPYRYLGDIDTETGKYVETLIHNDRTDLVGRLVTEGAILGMLASQLDSHKQEKDGNNPRISLSLSELERIKGLTEMIQNHPEDKPSIEHLADQLGLSQKKLQRGIRHVYGYSAHEFITNVRMELARELMETTDMNVSEICYNIGYSSRSHFSKVFRDRFGVLPSSYKGST